MDELDDSQRQILNNFTEVTGVMDMEVAIATLASLDWNLEKAIESQLNDSFMDTTTAASSSSAAPLVDCDEAASSSSPTFRRPHSPVFPPIAPFLQNHFGMPPLPNRAATSRTARAFEVAADTESDDGDDYFGEVSDSDKPGASEKNCLPLMPTECGSAIEATQNFVSVFDSRFVNGSKMSPSFFVGSLGAALREAFDCPDRPICERRPLAIYLHHDKAIAANIFPAVVMCNDQISTLMRMQFVLWPWDVTRKENQEKLSTFFTEYGLADVRSAWRALGRKPDDYPMLLLLSKDSGTVSLVDFAKGHESLDSVMEKLLKTVEAYSDVKKNAQAEEMERQERERIRNEQAAEYEASLAADRARMEEKERVEKEKRDTEKKEHEEREEEEKKKRRLANALPDEPPEGLSTLAVKFRLPDGEQVLRRFRKFEPLSILLSFLASKGFAADKFRFFNSDFPKKDVTEMDSLATFQQLKWPAREQIFVEER